MNNYRAITVTILLAVFAPLAMASVPIDKPAQQQKGSEQRQQAGEHRQDAEKRQDGERRRDMEKRQEEERRQDAERKREMEQRQGEERREDAERRRQTDQRQGAERRQDAERRRDAEARSMAPGQIRADELVGHKVISRQNHKEVGKLTGFVMDETGQIDAAIIEHGGFLGFFTNQVAVPWNQFDLSEDGTTIITHLDRKQIKSATPYKGN